jgi:hypothetical protein
MRLLTIVSNWLTQLRINFTTNNGIQITDFIGIN